MLIHYIVKREDVIAVNLHLFKVPSRLRTIAWLYSLFSSIVMFFILQFRNNISDLIEIGLSLLFAVGFGMLVLQYLKILVLWRLKKKQPEKQLGGTVLEFNENGITQYGKKGVKLYSWRYVKKLTSDLERYYIRLPKSKCLAIPRHSLESEYNFVDYIEHYTGLQNKERLARLPGRSFKWTLIFLLIMILALGYYRFIPSYRVDTVVRKTYDLFVEEYPDKKTDLKIKETTSQLDIDAATEALSRINTSNYRYQKYEFTTLPLALIIGDAQTQLNDREGKVSFIPKAPSKEVESEKKRVTKNSNDSPIISLLRNFPELQKKWHAVPYGLKEYVMIPSLEDLPFEKMQVQIEMSQKDMVNVDFLSENSTVRTAFWLPDKAEDEPVSEKEVKLSHDITGYINEKKGELFWHDSVADSRIMYGVWLEGEEGFNEEIAIKIANSMIGEGRVDESNFNPFIQ